MRIRAILFDMGDIFFDATRWRRAVAQHLREAGIDIDYERLCRQWEAKLKDVYVGRREYWGAFRELLGDLGLVDSEADRTMTFARGQAAEVERRKLFDGVASTLAELRRRGVRLAVLSDTESREARVRQRLTELGIEAYFDAVVTSVDIGHAKPDPEAYRAALTRLGLGAAEAVFVGHDEDELDGARRCGLQAIAYNYVGTVSADHCLAHFSELLDWVGTGDAG